MTLLVGLALAEDPAAPDVPPSDAPPLEVQPAEAPPAEVQPERAPGEPEVIVVYGDLAVQRARTAVLSELKQQGYTEVIDKGDYLLLRHEQAWKGEVIVHDDGWVRLKRQPAQIESPDLPYAKKGSAVAWAHCVVIPTMCMRVGGVTVSRRRWLGVSEATMSDLAPYAAVYGDKVADRHVDDVLVTLPDRLVALWETGVPLEGDVPLATPAERKQAILAYWESRTDTIWGDRVRAVIDAFVRAEIQGTEHEFTADEIATFNAGRRCDRAFDLTRDWDAIFAADAGIPR